MWSRPRSGYAASVVADNGSVTQTLLVVVLFIGALATAPWLLRQWQQRHAAAQAQAGVAAKVLSVVAVGPQQRVVLLEIAAEQEKTRLVLGVTAQNISCLHVLPPVATASASATVEPPIPFAQVVAQATQASHAKDSSHA